MAKKRKLDAVPLGEIDASDIATVFGAVAKVKGDPMFLEVTTSASYFNGDSFPSFCISLESSGIQVEFLGKTAQVTFRAAALFIRNAGSKLNEYLEHSSCEVLRAEEFIREASNG